MSLHTGYSGLSQCFRIVGETESGPAALRGFCLLKSLLTSLSRMERVVTVEGEEGGGSEVGSCEAEASAVVGAVQMLGWGWEWGARNGWAGGGGRCHGGWCQDCSIVHQSDSRTHSSCWPGVSRLWSGRSEERRAAK